MRLLSPLSQGWGGEPPPWGAQPAPALGRHGEHGRRAVQGGLWDGKLLPTESKALPPKKLTEASSARRHGHAFKPHAVGSSLAGQSQDRQFGSVCPAASCGLPPLPCIAGCHRLLGDRARLTPPPPGEDPNGPAATLDQANAPTQAHVCANCSLPCSVLPALAVPQDS